MLIYAHRGASATYPENTLVAISKAIESGADGIEVDIQVSADHVPVLMHDRTVDRTTNGSGAVETLTLAQLQKLSAGQGERIPTLAETLGTIDGRAHLDIELKSSGIESLVLAELGRFPDARWAISSFDWTSLERVRSLSPDAELWLIATHVSNAMHDTAVALGATAVSIWSGSYTGETAHSLRSAGLNAVLWTINEPKDARAGQRLGAYAVCTDDPARIRQALDSD